jgi:hypothetical protein
MANKKLILVCILFLLLLALPTFSAQLGIGVEPTIVDVYLSDSNRLTYVPFKLSNPSADADDMYTLEINEELKDYVHFNCSSYTEYWCEGKQIFVPKNTPRLNGVVLKVLFEKKTSEAANFTSFMTFSANPIINGAGNVALKPQIQVKVNIHQTFSPISTPSGQTPSGSSSGSNSMPSTPTNNVVVGDKIQNTIWQGIQDKINPVKPAPPRRNETTEINGTNATEDVIITEAPQVTKPPEQNNLVLFFAAIGIIVLIIGAYGYFKGHSYGIKMDRGTIRSIMLVIIPLMFLFVLPSLTFADGVSINITVCPALVNITNQTTCENCNHYWYSSACHTSPYVAPAPTGLITGSAASISLFVIFLLLFACVYIAFFRKHEEHITVIEIMERIILIAFILLVAGAFLSMIA